MLPFVRMLSYGNLAPGIKYKKVQSYNAGFMVLTNDGKLYSTGYDRYGHLGGVGDTLTKWRLLNSECDYFWTGQYGTIYYTKSGKYFFSGTKRLLGELSGVQLTFIDITSKMGIVSFNSVSPKDTDIKIGFDAMYYMNRTVNSNLYGMGSNQEYSLGLNNKTPVLSWTLIINTVRDYDCSTASVMVNLTSNSYMAAGAVGEIGVTMATFGTITPPIQGEHKCFISKYGGYIIANSNSMWGLGYNGVTMGVGNSTSTIHTPTTLINASTMAAKLPTVYPQTYNSNYGTIIKLSDGTYGVGSNNSLPLTSAVPTGTILTFTKMAASPIALNDITGLGVNSFTSYVASEDEIYLCGRIADVPGYSGMANTGTWVKLPPIQDNLL